jgi:hypothetical protein
MSIFESYTISFSGREWRKTKESNHLVRTNLVHKILRVNESRLNASLECEESH